MDDVMTPQPQEHVQGRSNSTNHRKKMSDGGQPRAPCVCMQPTICVLCKLASGEAKAARRLVVAVMVIKASLEIEILVFIFVFVKMTFSFSMQQCVCE
eukprot:s3058_g14.t1